MLTSLIATILGMVGGLLPDVMKEIRDSRNAAREIEHMRVMAELQLQAAKATADGRLREVEAGARAQEMQYLAQLVESQSKPTGIAWVDAFNAILRPTCVSMIMALYMIVAVPFTLAIIYQAAGGDWSAWETAGKLIFGSMVGESFMAIFGFLFGYRSAGKKIGGLVA